MRVWTAEEIRERLFGIQDELVKVEAEREALIALRDGCEKWLAFYARPPKHRRRSQEAISPWRFASQMFSHKTRLLYDDRFVVSKPKLSVPRTTQWVKADLSVSVKGRGLSRMESKER